MSKATKYQAVEDILGRPREWKGVPITVPESHIMTSLREALMDLDASTASHDAWLGKVVAATTPLDDETALRMALATGALQSELVRECLDAAGLAGAIGKRTPPPPPDPSQSQG